MHLDTFGCLLFGAGGAKLPLALPVVHLGCITSSAQLAEAYSAADLTVVPSIVDNLPNTVAESFACGTPVVGFDICGISEMIVSRENGFKAVAGDAEALAEGIRWCLTDDHRHARLCRCARQTAVERYDLRRCAEAMVGLYSQVLLTARARMLDREIGS